MWTATNIQQIKLRGDLYTITINIHYTNVMSVLHTYVNLIKLWEFSRKGIRDCDCSELVIYSFKCTDKVGNFR